MCKALALTLSALLGAACAGSQTGLEYAGTVTVSSPELVNTNVDGVQVVADADQPVFFTDDAYWLYHNGWYQSQRYDRGFVRVTAPPERLRHIDQPMAYVHFRAHAQSAHNQQQPPTNYEPREPDQVKPQPQTEPIPQPQQAPLQPPTVPQPPIPNPRPPQQQPPIDPGSPGTPDQNPQPQTPQPPNPPPPQ